MSGLFGVVAKNGNCIQDLFYGVDYHSHLGTEYGGLAVRGGDFIRQIHSIGQSQFKSKFFADYQRLSGNKGIGAISALDEQPIYLKSKLGEFCIVTDGFIENSEQLAAGLLSRGVSFSEVSKNQVNMTELVAKLINTGSSIVDGIEKMFVQIKGACSLLLLHADGIYAARDRFGSTSLALARREDTYAVSSETSAFPNNGYTLCAFLRPGEIVLLSERGLSRKCAGDPADNQICAFLWIYTGFPASSYEGIAVETVRERCGAALARRDTDIVVDMVAGVPDSGVAHAIGYAMASGKPYRRPLVKYTPGYGRSYTPPSQAIRDLVAKMKLVPVREIIENNRIVLCDDSIVRGTQLKNFAIKKLWDNGAREIHVRPACPPLMFPCRFNSSTRSIHELAARKAIRALEGKDVSDVSAYLDPASKQYAAMVRWIRDDLGVTTLRYQRTEDMVAAIGMPSDRVCLYCWTGECPARERLCKKKCVRGTKKAAKKRTVAVS